MSEAVDPIVPLPVDVVDPGVGFVYRWVNLVNGKMYIGSHDGSNSKYLASGIAFKNAVRKYGLTDFKRQILYIGEDFREIEESFLISVDACNNSLYYNLKNTAIGFGSKESNPNFGKTGKDHPKFGVPCSEENKAKLSKERKGNPAFGRSGEKNHNYGRNFSEETRAKIGAAHRGSKSHQYGRVRTKEEREHLSKMNKGRIYPKKSCPHCPAIGGGGAMSKYHFDNCKYKKRED